MFEELHRQWSRGYYRHELAVLAGGSIVLSTGGSPAVASLPHRLASGTVAFPVTGGAVRFAAARSAQTALLELLCHRGVGISGSRWVQTHAQSLRGRKHSVGYPSRV